MKKYFGSIDPYKPIKTDIVIVDYSEKISTNNSYKNDYEHFYKLLKQSMRIPSRLLRKEIYHIREEKLKKILYGTQ